MKALYSGTVRVRATQCDAVPVRVYDTPSFYDTLWLTLCADGVLRSGSKVTESSTYVIILISMQVLLGSAAMPAADLA